MSPDSILFLNGSFGNAIKATFIRGEKIFELSNHLSNVLATLSDKRIQNSSLGSNVDFYRADVNNTTDYYPFGMPMPSRKYSQTNGNYRYSYNGKENDNEVKGDGNQIAFEERIYDARLGKFLSIDPIAFEYPFQSTYAFAANNPITLVDVRGMGLGDPVKHTVVKGDNLSKIARKYGVSIKDIVAQNDIKDKNKIKPGQILTVNPEADFSKNPRGGYQNPENAEGKEVTTATICVYDSKTFKSSAMDMLMKAQTEKGKILLPIV